MAANVANSNEIAADETVADEYMSPNDPRPAVLSRLSKSSSIEVPYTCVSPPAASKNRKLQLVQEIYSSQHNF